MWENDGPFLKGYEVLRIPVVKDGKPAWPEVFGMERIDELRSRVGPEQFDAQMLLEPRKGAARKFGTGRLRFYSDELEVREANFTRAFRIGGRDIVSCSCFWDPAFGMEGGDNSVVSCVYKSGQGDYLLHDIEYMKCGEETGRHSARIQCECVSNFVRRNLCPSITVETNGMGMFLPEILGETFEEHKVPCRVEGKNSNNNKNLRILCSFGAVTVAGYLYIGERVKNSPFVAEFADWSVDSTDRDDGLDSVALAISGVFHPLSDKVLRPASRLAGRTFKVKDIL